MSGQEFSVKLPRGMKHGYRSGDMRNKATIYRIWIDIVRRWFARGESCNPAANLRLVA